MTARVFLFLRTRPERAIRPSPVGSIFHPVVGWQAGALAAVQNRSAALSLAWGAPCSGLRDLLLPSFGGNIEFSERIRPAGGRIVLNRKEFNGRHPLLTGNPYEESERTADTIRRANETAA